MLALQRQKMNAEARRPTVGALTVALRISQQVENATIVFIVCDRGDRYLTTGCSRSDTGKAIFCVSSSRVSGNVAYASEGSIFFSVFHAWRHL